MVDQTQPSSNSYAGSPAMLTPGSSGIPNPHSSPTSNPTRYPQPTPAASHRMIQGHSSILAPTPIERSAGRFLRATNPNDALTQAAGGGNEGGNNQASPGSGGQPSNNDGTGFDMGSFWNQPPPSTGNPPANQQGSDGQAAGGGGQDDNAAFGTQLSTQLGQLNFAPVMTPEISAAIAEGNLDSFNAAMTVHGRNVTQQALQMSLQVMQRLSDQLLSEVDRRTQGTLHSRDNNQALSEAIPLAKDPAMAPVVQSVFNQAMTHHKGDRAKAIEMTKSFLKGVHGNLQQSGEALGIPPANPGDNHQTTSPTNWIESLVGRAAGG